MIQNASPFRLSFLRLAERLRAVAGWRRAGMAFGFGLLAALALPPMNIVPVLWLCFPALIFLLQGTVKRRQAFVVGWCFAFGFFLLGLYWIAAAMFVDIAQFWWAVPLAVAGLPAFFALYYGMAAVLAQRWGTKGLHGIVGFTLLWFLADYARGHCLTGFPWNLEGYSWDKILPVLQITSVIGIYGLTLVTLVMACLPALLVEPSKQGRRLVIGSLVVLAAMGIWGAWRLNQASLDTVPDVRLRIVQPNIDQAHKWRVDEREENFQQILDYSSAPAEKPVTHIIWPETAATFYLSEDAAHRHDIAERLPSAGAVLTGVIRRHADADGQEHYYNSLIAVDGLARIMAGYDKFHLVPFGEYIPFRHILPLPTLVNLGLDFTAGDGVHTLRVLGLPSFSPLVCYEAIFPGDVIDADDRPHFMVNITNDGWYGHTAGPYQHFATVRVRAIEEGLPLVRAANTGISGVVDAYGRMVKRLGVGRSGFIDSDLPQDIPPTLFSRWHDYPLWILFSVLLSICLWFRTRNHIRRQPENPKKV